MINPFILFRNKAIANIVLEASAVYGMSDMAEIFCEDIERVSGIRPKITQEPQEGSTYVVLIATCGHSEILDSLEKEGLVDLSGVRGKREVYGIFRAKQFLVIAGSDKRGTIYGMFHISEKIGVSPWVYWADAVPVRRVEVIFKGDICTVSKEPSVRYRGFFINDEQPCFGNWAKEKFGSAKPGPKLYRLIFELLLRLKGNYLWPAMWRSDFTLDNLENARLADKMGVIIGTSHHEPCCRSGGEFQKLRRENKAYGEEWSFLSNAAGITEFWKDGLIRNREFESLITIGMRGENDSYLMPEDATLEDNINVLKEAITVQKRLIAEYGNQEHPQLLAIYKEVEDYYHGDEHTQGLKDWEVLKDDILMLCDDNFGHVRTLPGPEAKDHPGGYGMYYHLDYYGAPVSYLWINSTPLTRIWEQMTMAYEFGVRAAWIVNVGDIKNQELPLSYFLDLAYDFDAWGTEQINRTDEYTRQWLRGLGFAEKYIEDSAELIEVYTRWNGMCRPEVLRPDTYHPVHFEEAWEMHLMVHTSQMLAEELWEKIQKSSLADCFYELVYYPLMASAYVIEMNLYAGFNRYYVEQGMLRGDDYAKRVEYYARRDRDLAEEYHKRVKGKWNHMQAVGHVGYRGWNDEGWQYPFSMNLNPIDVPRLLVSVSGETGCTGGNPWRRKTLEIKLAKEVKPCWGFMVANGGIAEMKYRVEWDAKWLEIVKAYGDIRFVSSPRQFYRKADEVVKPSPSPIKDEILFEEDYYIYLKPELLPKDPKDWNTTIRIYGENCEQTAELSENEFSETRVDIRVSVEDLNLDDIERHAFVECDGILSVEARHYESAGAAGDACYKKIENYGRTEGGIKAFPVTASFSDPRHAPYVVYKFYVKEAGEFTLTLYTSANNPVVYNGKMRMAVRTNDGEFEAVNTIPDEGYVPWKSQAWSKGVLEQIHKTDCRVSFKKGNNLLYIAAMDPGVVLEKLVLVRDGVSCPDSYLGAQESLIRAKRKEEQ